MMFSATLSAKTKEVCKMYMKDPFELYVDSDSKLTLHGLKQYFVKLEENKKIMKLIELLDDLEFNQVIIFTKSQAYA
jgi:ATP-dependent RNA helicase UAP56/SUB2